ncbi:MAG TPA: protein kinase [Thermoanaerobaculia bacterium]|nr:protein kinase [Thermoanaerobaculia bacterium]
MPLQPNAMLGPYQIIGTIGEGGMGVVYRAKDTRLGRDVAIKVLTQVAVSDRERLVRFEQEARATGMLNHPNLLTVYDVGRDAEDNPFLVTELLEGETLRSRLDRGPLSPRKAVDAALQMAQGLAAAHEKGIVHRDLKPDNVFLTRDGRLKILDFGIAKLTNARPDGPTFEMAATEPGMVLGTVGYMSPEQVRGEPVDHRSDLFSLGTIFFEMLTGTRAFRRNSAIETLSAILKEEPPDLMELVPAIPPPLERLVRHCLEKDREHRFHSAQDLAFNLETLAAMSGTSTLSGMARPANVTGAMRTPSTPPTPTSTVRATSATPTTRTTARPALKPKRRVSPVLLALLYLVSLAGVAYATWLFAHRKTEEVVEPQFHRLTFRRGEVRNARFSPDGETIVYSAAWDGHAPEVFVSSRRSPEARPLGVPESEILAVSRSAELAILLRRDRVSNLGTLARVPLAGGMPREIAESVLTADWAPDGQSMAIIRQQGEEIRVEYPIGSVRYRTPHYVRDVRVSPDGKRLAILEPSKGEWELAIIDHARPVTIARGWARGATGIAWSGDGTEVWVSGTNSSAPPALYAVNVEKGTIRLVTRLTGATRIFDLSPNREALVSNGMWRAALMVGRRVVESSSVPAATTTAPPLDDSSTRRLVDSEKDLSWLDWSILADVSPDGRSILFSETREGGGAKSAVYLRRADAPAPLRLADGIADALSPDGKWALAHQGAKLVIIPTGTGEAREVKVDGVFESGAAWFPDSRRVVVGGAVGNGGYRLHVVDTLDETVKPLSPENIWSGGIRSFAVSPDSRFVAGMNAQGTIVLYPVDGTSSMPVDGSASIPVAGVEAGEIPIQFAADGASLFVYRPTTLPARVHRVTLATGQRELWRELTAADPAGVYKIAPVAITPDGNAYAYTALRVLSELYLTEGVY